MTSWAEDHILYLSEKDVEQACQGFDSVAIIREVFKMHHMGQTILPDEAYLAWCNDKGESVRSLNMPGYVGGSLGIAGTKIINGNIHNPQRGQARASGLTLLYDNTSVRIVCIMEGAYLSSLRTASVTALATDMLKGGEIECMAIIGAGVLAQAHIALLVKQLPSLRQVRVFDLAKERIVALESSLAAVLENNHVHLQHSSSAEEAIRPAQLIVPATTTTDGYIRYEWLQAGALLVNISLDDPLPEVVLQANKVIVDDWNLVKNDTRRLLGRMYHEGKITGPNEPDTGDKMGCRSIDAELGEIVAGTKVGRDEPHEIILVNPFGLSIEDIALAAYVYQAASERGIGVKLAR